MARIAFLVGEDWFFASHFLPMGRALLARGHEVAILTRLSGKAEALEAEGFQLYPLPGRRNASGPAALWRELLAIARFLAEQRPDLLHCISLKNCLLGGLASLGRRMALVLAVTGFGLLGADHGVKARAARLIIRIWLGKIMLLKRRSRLLLENPDDLAMLQLAGFPPPSRALIIGGAGVDPERFTPQPEPAAPPLVVAMVSRMLWSKGPDLAVAAVQQLADQDGLALQLRLVGASDSDNPRAVPEATLKQWSAHPAIEWAGPSSDIPAMWASAHIAVLPSRGGEGLPRALLEAGACGKAIITSDVPGCRHFISDEETGLLVPPDDADALAGALRRLAHDAGLRTRLGTACRARIEQRHTEAHIGAAVACLHEGLVSAARHSAPEG